MGRFLMRQGTRVFRIRICRRVVRHRLAILLLLTGSAGLLVLPMTVQANGLGRNQASPYADSPLLADDLLAPLMKPTPPYTRSLHPVLHPVVVVRVQQRQRPRRSVHTSPPPAAPPPASGDVLRAGFCAGVAVVWPTTIGPWTVPAGCYSHIYTPNPARYVSRPSYGWCNWWPEVLHPWLAGSAALSLPGHSMPAIGATVYFAPYVQGAGGAGHYAEVVAIAPGGHWVLITEMNFAWRGAGWARVDYRFIHVGAGVSFRY